MTTDAFHRKVSGEVFEKMTSARLTSFNESDFYKALYPILKKENAFDGRTYHGRKIRPLVEKMFVEFQQEQEPSNFVLT